MVNLFIVNSQGRHESISTVRHGVDLTHCLIYFLFFLDRTFDLLHIVCDPADAFTHAQPQLKDNLQTQIHFY